MNERALNETVSIEVEPRVDPGTLSAASEGALSSSATRRVRATKGLARGMKVDEVDLAARRRAACVLEVLAGVRSPEEAAMALEVQLGTYFQIEERALRGLLSSCGPQPRGRAPDYAKALEESRRRVGELEREVQRHQALLRSAQRTAGLLSESRGSSLSRAPAAPSRVVVSSASSRRSGRVPKARALRAVAALGGGAGGGTKSVASAAGSSVASTATGEGTS